MLQPWTFRSLISEECHGNVASFITWCYNINPKDNVILETKMDKEVLWKVYYIVIKDSIFKATFRTTEGKAINKVTHYDRSYTFIIKVNHSYSIRKWVLD